jgi:hypothetical protein
MTLKERFIRYILRNSDKTQGNLDMEEKKVFNTMIAIKEHYLTYLEKANVLDMDQDDEDVLNLDNAERQFLEHPEFKNINADILENLISKHNAFCSQNALYAEKFNNSLESFKKEQQEYVQHILKYYKHKEHKLTEDDLSFAMVFEAIFDDLKQNEKAKKMMDFPDISEIDTNTANTLASKMYEFVENNQPRYSGDSEQQFIEEFEKRTKVFKQKKLLFSNLSKEIEDKVLKGKTLKEAYKAKRRTNSRFGILGTLFKKRSSRNEIIEELSNALETFKSEPNDFTLRDLSNAIKETQKKITFEKNERGYFKRSAMQDLTISLEKEIENFTAKEQTLKVTLK